MQQKNDVKQQRNNPHHPEVSIVIPCLNEEKTIGICIEKAKKAIHLFSKTGISDAHCGMRAFTKEAFQGMNLKTEGMEFASEMIINASIR